VILKVARRLLHGIKGMHVTYHPHTVDTETFSCDALARISVEVWTAVVLRFPSAGWFSVFCSDFVFARRLLHIMMCISCKIIKITGKLRL